MKLFLTPILGQETPEFEVQESAELFLEAYSDEFQENFFEALKQKGIENYDKAINYLLECKRIDPSNRVVDHELAKVYLEEKQYPLAEEYSLTALRADPENLWYTDTFVKTLLKQGKSIDKVKSELPFGSSKFEENLAWVFFKRKNYEVALSILKAAKKSDFTIQLSARINDSIELKDKETTQEGLSGADEGFAASDSLEDYKNRIETLLSANSASALEKISQEALEIYPSQPYFYYAHGYALLRNAKYQEAIDTMEAGLDYLFDDDALANKMYQELAEAYNSINNSVKANMYLRKIKPGF
ncbi:tetratricopeptide repeat protein [Pareuzebyella sediminis]|uniref:tetratricopeptide repeat protein n=1 Tax=Pareuzebyella sediminis TaxID=2607998 RepID=UPI0011F0107E|nr:hypothetical protein [Pareuzebyella sediminis]